MDKIIDQQDTEDIVSVYNGDKAAFGRIVHRYTGVLYNLSLRMLGKNEDAEEAVQEIFLLIYRKLNKYDTDKRFYSWMFTVAINYLRSELRKSGKNRVEYESAFDENIHSDLSGMGINIPEYEAEKKAATNAVISALMKLPVKYREVFILREIEGFSVKETAEALKISENTVKTLSRRGKEKLRANLILTEWK